MLLKRNCSNEEYLVTLQMWNLSVTSALPGMDTQCPPHGAQQDGLLAGYCLNKIMSNLNCYFSTAKQKVEEYI